MQIDRLKRREFITLLGGGVAALPLSARAQPHKGPVRLGFLPIGSPRNDYDRSLVEAFQDGLGRVGLIENQNIVLDIVWVGDDPDQAVSQELQRGAELLITSGSSVSVAARRQTSTIPIVFLHVGACHVLGAMPPGSATFLRN
jgi:putative ABC transport system substrate-binding protein